MIVISEVILTVFAESQLIRLCGEPIEDFHSARLKALQLLFAAHHSFFH